MNAATAVISEINLKRHALIAKLLKKKPMKALDMAKALGLTEAYFRIVFAGMRDQVHICGWDDKSARGAAIWAWGTGEDASKIPGKRGIPPTQDQIKERCYFRPQPVARDWSVEMMFGKAYVGLNAELRGMA